MKTIEKGTVLSQDSIVLEKEEVELFEQFQVFYKDYKSGVFQRNIAEKITDFVRTPIDEEAV